MDITQLKYFLMTAETMNYTRAAERLYISRQALRQAISVLEKEIGTPLFHNERNKLSLTAAGEYLRLSGAEVVRSFDKMAAGLERFAKEETTLRIAFSRSLFPFMLPEADGILRQFQTRYPEIRLEILQMSNDEVLQALMAGEIHGGGVIQMPCYRPGMTIEVLDEHRTILSYSGAHPLQGRQQVTAEELEPFLCLGMGSMEHSMVPLWEECRRKGICLQYEVVPDAIDAFYRIAHDQAVAFDVYREDLSNYYDGNFSFLENYHWQIGLLYGEETEKRQEMRLLSRFLAREYERVKEEQRVSGILPPPRGPV